MRDDLFSLVYEELSAQAHWQRAQWHGDYTLNTTGLVREAYLYAKQHRAEKRSGDVQKLSLEEMKGLLEGTVALTEERAETLLLLDDWRHSPLPTALTH